MPTPERHPFPKGILLGFTHGTLECRQINPTREFQCGFLGVQTLRHSQPSFITWLGQRSFYIVGVEAGDQVHPQSPDNRWELTVASEEDVRAAHAAATEGAAKWGIQYVSPISTLDGYPWFYLKDLNGNHWGISTRGVDWVESAFARGDA